jgi:putative transposase
MTGRRRDSIGAVSSPYNGHRPHRSLGQQPPLATPPPMIAERTPISEPIPLDRLRRRDRLGGLLHEYELAV